MATPLTEVEARFCIPDVIEDKLTELGGHLEKELTFTDYYYDTEDWALSLEDFWLRQRDTLWQLKYPPPQGRSQITTECDQYTETENESQICQLLSAILRKGTAEDHDVRSLMTLASCKVFCEYTTTRKSYKFKNEENISVDLDMTNFGYRVGEIETLTSGSTDVALSVVDGFAEKLGVKLSAAIPSKMDVFLMEHHPDHPSLD